jgi:hypothetical protein
VTTPRSSCPGGECHSSPGRKPPARNKINTNTVLENGADLCRKLAQLHTAWIIFGKYTWVDSAKRRRVLLPVMVDRRLQATKITLEMLEKIAAKYELG